MKSHGKVFDERGLPIQGVVVRATNDADNNAVATDENGKFRIKPLKPGSYDVQALMMGMDTLIMKNVQVQPDKITFTGDLKMVEHVFEGPGITLYGWTTPLISKSGSMMQTLTSEELMHLPSASAGRISDILKSMTSDIKPATDGSSGFSVRGSREGQTLFFVDGMKVRSSDIVIPASGIGSVSFYAGGIPAKYGDTTAGVVVVETKSYLEDYYKKMNQ